MAIRYVRALTGGHRTPWANRDLGLVLAFVAGAINAGGFLAVAQYTSHVTGIVSSMADNIVLGSYDLVGVAGAGLVSFFLGAACSAVIVNLARRRGLTGQYAFPLLLEALLLFCFGVLGTRLASFQGLYVPLAVVLLCFIMGLQNALITKLSSGEIRTTHLTGIVTDIGIEVGRLLLKSCNRERLAVLCSLAACFFLGALTGALGFKQFGYIATFPLAFVLLILAIVPAIDDVVSARRRRVTGRGDDAS